GRGAGLFVRDGSITAKTKYKKGSEGATLYLFARPILPRLHPAIARKSHSHICMCSNGTRLNSNSPMIDGAYTIGFRVIAARQIWWQSEQSRQKSGDSADR